MNQKYAFDLIYDSICVFSTLFNFLSFLFYALHPLSILKTNGEEIFVTVTLRFSPRQNTYWFNIVDTSRV